MQRSYLSTLISSLLDDRSGKEYVIEFFEYPKKPDEPLANNDGAFGEVLFGDERTVVGRAANAKFNRKPENDTPSER